VCNKFSRVEFRTSLYSYLFGFVQSVKIHRLQSDLGEKRLFGSNLEHVYCKVKRTQVNTCVWCVYQMRYQKAIGQPPVLRASRSWFGCSVCDMALCQNTDC
jgi:hypothetical protein